MNTTLPQQLDDYVWAFESAAPGASLEDHLPPRDSSLYMPVLLELVRIDLEARWSGSTAQPLADYLTHFPELALDPASLREIAYEEYRLRRQAGESIRPREYAEAYGIDTSGWYDPPSQQSCEANEGPVKFPEVGDRFAGYRLESELGRGSFARVFLARDEGLSMRPVVLKVAPSEFVREAHTLARLQHTNIVPVYSLHRDGPLAALCLPYFGATTFAVVLSQLRAGQSLPRTDAPGGRKLAHRSHVQAVLWLMGRLAEGLAHAHDRGVLHRDIKPANLLLADDGTPMLLDFNLAEDCQADSSGWAGGTPAYMAPEYLDALSRGKAVSTTGGDLFALGVVMYELLCTKHPFPAVCESPPDPRVLAACHRLATEDIRRHNPAVDAGSAAIVRRCIASDPTRRYQSAHDLAEDIDRHLTNRPLRHVPESVGSRLWKWGRRHPALSSSVTVAIAAGLCVLVLVVLLMLAARSRQQLAAEREFARTLTASDEITLLLAQRQGQRLGEGIDRCQEVARTYRVLEREDWTEGDLVRMLDNERRIELRSRMGEILWLWSRADTWLKGQPEESQRLLDRAVGCYPPDEVPGTLARQRALWLQSQGKTDEAQELIRSIPVPRNAREHYLDLLSTVGEGRWSEALPRLRALTEGARDQPVPWLLLASAYAELGRHDQARTCGEVATALAPQWHLAWFHHGMLALHRNDHREAKPCFERVLRLRPAMPEARVNLALAELGVGRPTEAIEQLNLAQQEGATITRIHFIRAAAHRRAGDEAAARRDIEAGRRLEPSDEAGWVARALSYLPADSASARADLDALLARNPDSVLALMNRAHILSEYLKRTEDAATDLDRVLHLRPDDTLARAGRAVLRARLGRRAEAHDDAERVVRDADQAGFVYQAACVYALTAKQHHADRREALRLLRRAFRREARWIDIAPADHDLSALHHDTDFVELLSQARAWHRGE